MRCDGEVVSVPDQVLADSTLAMRNSDGNGGMFPDCIPLMPWTREAERPYPSRAYRIGRCFFSGSTIDLWCNTRVLWSLLPIGIGEGR